MRGMAKETDLPVMLGAHQDGFGGLTPEAEEPGRRRAHSSTQSSSWQSKAPTETHL